MPARQGYLRLRAATLLKLADPPFSLSPPLDSMAQMGRCDEVDDPIGDRLYRAVTSNVLPWEPWISGSLASVPTVPDDAADVSQARLDTERPSAKEP